MKELKMFRVKKIILKVYMIAVFKHVKVCHSKKGQDLSHVTSHSMRNKILRIYGIIVKIFNWPKFLVHCHLGKLTG